MKSGTAFVLIVMMCLRCEIFAVQAASYGSMLRGGISYMMHRLRQR